MTSWTTAPETETLYHSDMCDLNINPHVCWFKHPLSFTTNPIHREWVTRDDNISCGGSGQYLLGCAIGAIFMGMAWHELLECSHHHGDMGAVSMAAGIWGQTHKLRRISPRKTPWFLFRYEAAIATRSWVVGRLNGERYRRLVGSLALFPPGRTCWPEFLRSAQWLLCSYTGRDR